MTKKTNPRVYDVNPHSCPLTDLLFRSWCLATAAAAACCLVALVQSSGFEALFTWKGI